MNRLPKEVGSLFFETMNMATIKSEYQATTNYLFEQLPMFQRIGPAAFKKDLGNTLAMCAALGQPQLSFRTVHVAGTNGKGSSVHAIAAVLMKMGLKVGIYTSPHYKDFRERIKINRNYITMRGVVDFVEQNKELIDRVKPSFFEITVAMAFDWFAKNKVDIAIIETGMGGRLDSTNVLRPLLSVITNISFDHEQFLGNSLPAIAGEKAGIIKSRTPVVIGESHPETDPVFVGKANAEEAPITFADRIIRVESLRKTENGQVYRVWRNGELLYDELLFGLVGPFQDRNLVTVLQSLEVLRNILPDLSWRDESLLLGLSEIVYRTKMMGRWVKLGEQPLIIADSAHNEAGLRLVVEHLQSLGKTQIHFVLGFVEDKSLEKVLRLFPVNAKYYFTKADIPRGLDRKQLQAEARKYDLTGRSYITVRKAYNAARFWAKPDDLIYVGGSIFVVAEIL